MSATSIAPDGPAVLMMFPPEIFNGLLRALALAG